MQDIYKIFEFAKEAHLKANSFDKGTKAPYHWHLARCVIRLGSSATFDEKAAALLHDSLEDTAVVESDLRRLGLSQNCIDGIKLCSNIYFKDVTHKVWMKTIGQHSNVVGKKVKLADLADNHSFERMLGLDLHFKEERSQKALLEPIKIKIDNLSNAVFKNVNKKLKQKSHYGLWQRYVEDMEIILSNNEDKEIFKEVNLNSFSLFLDYQQLFDFIGKKEFLEYQEKQKVFGFRQPCRVQTIKDKVGQPYLVGIVNSSIANIYQKALAKILPEASEFIANQISRDNSAHHITLLTSAEYSRLMKEKPEHLNSLIADLNKSEIDFDFYTLGSIEDSIKNNKTYYALCESGYIQNFREKLGLKPKDLHCTIGFKEKDVFNRQKDMSTKVCNFSLVWEQVSHHFDNEKVNANKSGLKL